MPETDDDFYSPLRAGGFRGSRTPGFSSGPMNQATGTVSPLSSIGTNSVADQAAQTQLFDTSTSGKQEEQGAFSGLGQTILGGAAGYVGTDVGRTAGQAILGDTVNGVKVGGGASFGEGVSKGFSDLGTKVSGWFGGGGTQTASSGSNFVLPAGVSDGSLEAADLARDAASTSASPGVAAGSSGTGTIAEGFTSGSNIGAGAGSGLARAAVGIAMGEKPAQAIKSGVGTGLGTYVGLAISSGNPIGGFLGGAIGGFLGGRVICTELYAQGKIDPVIFRADILFSARRISPTTVRGYHVWAKPFVRLMRRSERATRLAAPIAIWRAEELAYQMGLRAKPNWRGKLVRWTFEPVCFCLGVCVEAENWINLRNTARVG